MRRGGLRNGTRPARWGLLLLLSGLLSCAYYNTFFVAKKNFRLAEESVAASQTDRLPSDAQRNYEIAIAQSRKVLKRHPKSRWADDAIYLMAASYYGKGDYDSSLIRLAELSQRFPKTPFRADATFLSGMCEAKRRNYAEASEHFERIFREYPKFHRMDEILLTQAETAASQRHKRQAIRDYERLVHSFPKSRFAEEALQRVGELHFEEGRYDSASIYFQRLVRSARDERVRLDAGILQAKTLIRMRRAEEALELLSEITPTEGEQQQAAQAGQRPVSQIGEVIPRIQLETAAALNALGRHSEAIEGLKGIVARYGSSTQAVEAQFQIGYTYETMLDSLDAARAGYDRVAQLAGRSIFKEQAAQRSAALRALAELEEKEESGDQEVEARAEAALRVAEIFYLERGLADEAIPKYQNVELEFPETRAAPRAAYALAYIRWKEKGDSLGAYEDLRTLVRKYPASSQARGALDLLAAQGADTSGLAALLVTPPPDTTAVAADSLAVGVDSLAVGVDSLTVGPDSLAVVVDSLAVTQAPDSASVTPLPGDSVSVVSDSLSRAPRFRRLGPEDELPPDSLALDREGSRDGAPREDEDRTSQFPIPPLPGRKP